MFGLMPLCFWLLEVCFKQELYLRADASMDAGQSSYPVTELLNAVASQQEASTVTGSPAAFVPWFTIVPCHSH